MHLKNISRRTGYYYLDPTIAKIQECYDKAASELNEILGPINVSKANTSGELIQIYADRQMQIEKALGVSPRSQIQKALLLNTGEFDKGKSKTTVIPEYRQQTQ